jgi:hypothetical protein
MRESYKRFIKTWIRFANPWIRTVSWLRILTPKRFDLCLMKGIRIRGSCILNVFKRFISWILFVDWFSKDSTCFHKTSRILSTIAQNESLRIQAGGLANPDLRIQTLKIRIVDSFRRPVFQRFVSWIRFVGLFSKDSFRGFVS